MPPSKRHSERGVSLFVSFEGGEGSGKTTQAARLAKYLTGLGYRVVQVHEPGGTTLGTYVREWVKATSSQMSPQAELFLFAAARAELVRRVIEPWLEQDSIVIADRYADSTTVYQGYARGLPLQQVKTVNELATGGRRPDITFLLDAPPGESLHRTRLQSSFSPAGTIDDIPRPEDSDKRRFEQLEPAFHRKVREGYLKIAKSEPERWVVIDATAQPGTVARRIRKAVADRLEAGAPRSADPAPETAVNPQQMQQRLGDAHRVEAPDGLSHPANSFRLSVAWEDQDYILVVTRASTDGRQLTEIYGVKASTNGDSEPQSRDPVLIDRLDGVWSEEDVLGKLGYQIARDAIRTE